MRLKKIKLAGFKSFVDPTTIPFPGEMTAVVGPNGCGKSNVIDAVRWVLGESSAKNLRGDAMTDVIFNGSTARSAVSQCSVELVFDNSSGRIAGEFAGYNELSVKRVVTKEAVSSYLLNGSKCRKRDITDLFLGTGLGPRSYAIIEQGMISKLIESRPQELRIFIEEAAGISKYKERRRETENRIKHTKENLERLEDIRAQLGEQLSKLKRQAAAATRYKELKALERSKKGQLAVHRWLKQNDLITATESEIAEKQNELEEVISKKRGDESSIVAYRDQQQNVKEQIADIQKEIFTTSTNITKIEQSQLFSKKRKQQIQMELQQLLSQEQQVTALAAETQLELQQVQDEIVEVEPEKLILEEAVENAQIEREEAELALGNFNEKHRQSESQYHTLKQQLQTSHGQIQNTMSMQLRTESRINELSAELQELSGNAATENAEELQAELLLVEEAQNNAQQSLDELKLQLEKQKITTKEAQDSQDSAYQELIAVKAQKEALEAISKPKVVHSETWQAHLDTRALIDSFDVEPGFEALVELVINRHKGAMIVADATASDIDASFYATKAGEVVYFQSEMTATKKANSLASKLKNPFVPQVFNTITVVESDEIALAKLESMLRDKQHQKNTTDFTIDWSIISKTGLWLFPDHLINGAGEEVDNYLSRQAEIERLSERCGALSTHFEQLKHQTDKYKEQEAKLYELLIRQEQTCKDYDEQAFRFSTQLAQLQQQITEQAFRQERVQQELDKHRLNAEEELETLALLNEEVETTALELAEYEEVMQNTQVQSEELHRALQSTRSRVEQLIAQSHETAMQVQQIKSRYSLLNEKQIGREAQQSEIREKIVLLEEEAEELSMPMEDQQEKLQALLDEKEQSIQQQTALQVELAEIEEMLIQAEKGQSGVNQAAERIKSEIESLRLQAEGAKVRAQSYLEQLDEMQQPLKPILEDLPDDIDEKEWQETLDKTAASLARLGAVNLAAVEEYETQAERKGHLDAQNDDLSQALDTLEAAIKKIEKETRNRFKATFDRINNDLKMLFPKVFGGGSAHLALTDDDMLDTGVTIMARPPGKKNSTIHLLSGGEKALTALSLVFAIFRLNPAPFCLLDEVDAPLDDANVGRFCKLVSEMSKTVQFIYITHNKVAMEMASHLTGVTMAEPGVSRMVAVDVEEAMAIAE